MYVHTLFSRLHASSTNGVFPPGQKLHLRLTNQRRFRVNSGLLDRDISCLEFFFTPCEERLAKQREERKTACLAVGVKNKNLQSAPLGYYNSLSLDI